jgi:hypothetical protein
MIKIFANHVCEMGLISNTYKEFLKLNNQTANSIQNLAKNLSIYFFEEVI